MNREASFNIITVFLPVVLGCLVTITAGGCASRTSGIEGHASTLKDDKDVVVHNVKTSRLVEIVSMKIQPAGEFIKAHVSVKSKHNKTQRLKYKVYWFDADGVELDPDSSPWKPLVIHGKETKSLQDVAPNPRAKSYKISIR